MPRGILGFDPKINREHFKCIWSLDCGWGSYEKTPDGTRIEVTEGALYINTLVLPYLSAVKEVLADGRSIDFTFDNGQIHFSPLAVRQSIEIR